MQNLQVTSSATAFHAGFPVSAMLDAYDVPAETGETAESREALVAAHLDQVYHVARGLSRRIPRTVEIDDLVGAGTIGLIAAADRYQSDRGIAFKTYAETRIRGAMLDYLRSLDWAPRRLRVAQRAARDATRRIEAANEVPSDDRVAAEMGISLNEYYGLRQSIDSLGVVSFDAPSPGENAPAAVPAVADAAESPLARYERSEKRERLAAAISELTEREQQVVSLSFVEELSLREIGEVFGVSESRVSQIRTQALRTLRALLDS